ncbi:MAG: hypothetical protein ACJ786_22705, partial [Catenulispora sp.]
GELRVLTRDLPVDLAQLNLQQAQQRTAQARPVEVRRDEAGRMQINIDNQAIQDRINQQLARHTERHRDRMQRTQERHRDRMERHATRHGRHWGSFGSWLSLSVLLTAIWLLSNITGDGHWGDYWPAWPIGITGALMIARSINRRN